MKEKLLTVYEMMEYMDISKTKAYELVNMKGFPALRIGTAIRIPKQALEEWIKENIA